MKKILFLLLSVAAFALAAASSGCSDGSDVDPVDGSGITEAGWKASNPASDTSILLDFPFTAAAAWTVVSDAAWCDVLTPEGNAGKCSLRLRLAANNDVSARTAHIEVTVRGAQRSESFDVVQAARKQQGEGLYREVNKWMYDYMEEKYLWNEPLPSLSLDYSLDYQSFLTSVLEGVAAHGNVNREDGRWEGDKRLRFYTTVVSGAPITPMAVGDRTTGTGISRLMPAQLPDQTVGLVIVAVTPGTPAAEAGLVRGDFITEVDGTKLTLSNYEELGEGLFTRQATIAVSEVFWSETGAEVRWKGTYRIVPTLFEEPAIYMDKVINVGDTHKAAYLLYMGFHMNYDQQLLDAFTRFRDQGADNLIIDLRYNNGGDVLSSAVLATLVAGKSYAGQLFSHFTYNATRTAAGEGSDLKIGEAETDIAPGGYEPLRRALDHALNLRTVYVICSSSTASASEMLINGLEGLGIDVRLIGTRTAGKNVGMEGVSAKFYSYDFTFYPVTFYTENAKGFKDYFGGMTPDLDRSDASIFPGEFGTQEDLYTLLAMQWIASGQMPEPTAATVSCCAAPRAGFGEMTAPAHRNARGGAIIRPRSAE